MQKNASHSKSAKILVACLASIALLTVLSMICLPMFLSTSWGKNIFTNVVKSETGFEVEIEQVSLSWFGSQSLRGIHAHRAKEEVFFTCQAITTDASLWRIISKKEIGHLNIIAPDVQMSKPFQIVSPLAAPRFQAASFASAPRAELALPPIELPVRGQCMIENGKVTFTPPGLDPVIFDQIALSVDLLQKDSLAFSLNCLTIQHESQGHITVKGSGSQLETPFPNLAIQSTISKLPVRGIDQFVSIFAPKFSGLLLAAIGSTIDLQANLSAGSGNIQITLNAQSPQLYAQMITSTMNGILSLQNPAVFQFNMTPALWQKLTPFVPSLNRLNLLQPSSLQFTISQFSCPLPLNQSNYSKASFEASLVTNPSQLLLQLNGSPLLVNRLSFNASSPSIEEGITLHLANDLQAKGQTGSISLDGKVNPQDLAGHLSLAGSQLPVDLLDMFASSSLSYATLLGPTAQVKGSLDLAAEQSQFRGSWNSAQLNIPEFHLMLKDQWTLLAPVTFSYELTPEIMHALVPDDTVQLTRTAPITGKIKTLSLPLEDLHKCRLEASLETNDVSLAGIFPLTLTSFPVVIDIQTLNQVSIQIDGDPIKASFLGAIDLNKRECTLSQPFTLQCQLAPDSLQKWNLPPFLSPVQVSLLMDPMKLSLSGLPIDKLKGHLSIPQIAFATKTQGKPITLHNLTLPFQWSSKEQNANVQLSAQVPNLLGNPGNVQGQVQLSRLNQKWNLASCIVDGQLALQTIPSTLLDIFSQTRLSPLIGPYFSSQCKFQSKTDQQTLTLKWTSDYLNLTSSLLIDQTKIQLQTSPTQMSWTLTPESYRALDSLLTHPTQNFMPFELKEPTTFSCTVSKLFIPIKPKVSVHSFADRFPQVALDPLSILITAQGNNPKMTIFDKSSQEMIQLSALTFSLDKTVSTGLNFALNTSIINQSTNAASATKNGSLSLLGKWEIPATPQGQADLTQLTGQFELKVQQLPSRILDLLARARGRTDFPFSTVFGHTINAAVSTDLKKFQGPISINLNTPLTRASVNGTIVNGALLLDEAIYAQMKITPEISRLVLKEVNPLNLSYLYSKDPVTLEIPAKGFYLPFYPLNLEKMAIPEATIELGKVFCRNEGNVNIALGLLKTKQFEQNRELMLWFAPIDISIQKGNASMDRTEILLADTYDICTWGKIDLVKDYVDMYLGLTAQTLERAFGIKNLPENYVLTIPMRGPADNVQINSGKATAKVALLLAWQQKNIAGAFGRSPAGAIVGELLGKVATLPDSDAKVPPPKHPFPWEVGASSKKSSHHYPHEKKRHFKQKEKPLKQILKIIK
jgi:hypothetical protein